MKLIEFARAKGRMLFKLYIFVLFIFLLQILLSYIFVYNSSLNQVETQLKELTMRIDKDLKFNGDTWNTSLYNSDPLTPYPNGSSGFLNPLYIITKEGFIIERSSPISGLLDTSDFKHLLQFQTPQTINTVTNEAWRILSQPIVRSGKTLGVIVVSYYNPRAAETTVIDRKMQENISLISSHLSFDNKQINTSQLDIRNIHYEFSFEVVDVYNNVLINNGRVPTYVDVSYFSKELRNKQKRIVTDEKLKQQYFVVSRTISNNVGEPVAIIVAGQSIHAITKTLQTFSLVDLIVSAFLIIPLLFYLVYNMKSEFIALISSNQLSSEKKIKSLFFDKKKSQVHIDQTIFDIPYSSNQYYICEALFLHPTKKWEYDELLEKIGDTDSETINIRKVYDAVLAINRKTNIHLIEYKNKVFSLNSNLLTALRKI